MKHVSLGSTPATGTFCLCCFFVADPSYRTFSDCVSLLNWALLKSSNPILFMSTFFYNRKLFIKEKPCTHMHPIFFECRTITQVSKHYTFNWCISILSINAAGHQYVTHIFGQSRNICLVGAKPEPTSCTSHSPRLHATRCQCFIISKTSQTPPLY